MLPQNRLDTRLEVNMAEGQEGGILHLSRHFSQEYPYAPCCLTSSVATVGVHEGVGHPLVLLEGALLCHAAV